jgi:hypothetical protein
MLVTLEQAKAQVRYGASYPETKILIDLAAAEAKAQSFLNRRVFADQDALDAAIAAAPDAQIVAGFTWMAGIDAASSVTDEAARAEMLDHVNAVYSAARATARQTYAGMVINDEIRKAILVTFEQLFIGSLDTAMPAGAESLLWPYRVGLGV